MYYIIEKHLNLISLTAKQKMSKMSSNQEVLFLRKINGEIEWIKNGDGDKDWKYVGNIENGKPNGHGTLTSLDGEKYEGE